MTWLRRRTAGPVVAAPVAPAAPVLPRPAWLDEDASAWPAGSLVPLDQVAAVIGVHSSAMAQRAARIGVAVVETDQGREFVSRPGALALVEGVRP